MTRFLTALCLLTTPALATDLPIAPGIPYPYPSGIYLGVAASGISGAASASGPLTAGPIAGARFGVDIGWAGRVNDTFWFVENTTYVQPIDAGGNLSLGTSMGFQQRVAVGVSQRLINQIVNLVPEFGSMTPAVPGIMVSSPHPYVFGSLWEDNVEYHLGDTHRRGWVVSYGGGIGALSRMTNGWILDTSVEYKRSNTLDTVRPYRDAYIATIRVKW